MDPQIPTSFIPKRPVVSGEVTSPSRSHVVGLLTLLTVVVVLATVISGVGVYLYQKSLVVQKQKFETSLTEARDGIGSDFLSDMKRLNARITGVKTLLQSHVVVSPLFAALESTTLRSVQYRTFSYEFRTDNATKQQMVEVKLTGAARSYSTIALQSDAFAQSSLIKNPVFSGLTIEDKTGNVLFQLTFDVTPEDLSFQSFIDAKMKTTGQQSIVIPDEVVPQSPEATQ